MIGQLSLEFLVALLIYTTFLLVLLNSQQLSKIKIKESLSFQKIKLNMLNSLISEQHILNRFLSFPVSQDCVITETEIFCKDLGELLSERIFISKSSEGYLE